MLLEDEPINIEIWTWILWYWINWINDGATGVSVGPKNEPNEIMAVAPRPVIRVLLIVTSQRGRSDQNSFRLVRLLRQKGINLCLTWRYLYFDAESTFWLLSRKTCCYTLEQSCDSKLCLKTSKDNFSIILRQTRCCPATIRKFIVKCDNLQRI